MILENELRQLFKNRSDCYADTWTKSDDTIPPTLVEGEVIQAMTEDRFIETVNEALRKHGVVRPEVEGAKAGRTVGKRSVGKSREGGFSGPTICPYCHSTEEDGHETWCPELRG